MRKVVVAVVVGPEMMMAEVDLAKPRVSTVTLGSFHSLVELSIGWVVDCRALDHFPVGQELVTTMGSAAVVVARRTVSISRK